MRRNKYMPKTFPQKTCMFWARYVELFNCFQKRTLELQNKHESHIFLLMFRRGLFSKGCYYFKMSDFKTCIYIELEGYISIKSIINRSNALYLTILCFIRAQRMNNEKDKSLKKTNQIYCWQRIYLFLKTMMAV